MNNEIENKMNESDATVDRIENTCAERDNIIRGLLFNRTVNVIAVSGREIVETAREIHGTSRVCTAALGRMLLAVSMMSAQLKSETDSITATIAGGGPAGNITVVGHMGGIVKGCSPIRRLNCRLTSSESWMFRVLSAAAVSCALFAICRCGSRMSAGASLLTAKLQMISQIIFTQANSSRRWFISA